eukprot:UN29629
MSSVFEASIKVPHSLKCCNGRGLFFTRSSISCIVRRLRCRISLLLDFFFFERVTIDDGGSRLAVDGFFNFFFPSTSRSSSFFSSFFTIGRPLAAGVVCEIFICGSRKEIGNIVGVVVFVEVLVDFFIVCFLLLNLGPVEGGFCFSNLNHFDHRYYWQLEL